MTYGPVPTAAIEPLMGVPSHFFPYFLFLILCFFPAFCYCFLVVQH